MSLPNQPDKAIFPIFAEETDDSFTFLGTGFFIDSDGTFLTARHVFADYGLERSGAFRIGMRTHPSGGRRHQVEAIQVSNRFDIALARAIDVEDAWPLTLATADVGADHDVLTEEYSGTIPKPPQEGPGLNLVSFTRKGNVITRRISEYPGPESAEVLELSFPALRGASGAPVLVYPTGEVIGMIVANVGHELVPAQVERVDYPDGTIEEIKYYLPSGLALHWSHLTEFVASPDR